MEDQAVHHWRARIKKRRGKSLNPIAIRELNLVAMMDMLTLILVFLLKSWSVSAMSIPVGEEMNIPDSKNMEAPLEAVKLTVTKIGGIQPGVIAVDEQKVLILDQQKIAQLQRMAKERSFLLPELQKELQKKADGIKFIASKNSNIKFDGKILVIADKETPYWLITQILYTSAESQFDRYNLVAAREKQ